MSYPKLITMLTWHDVTVSNGKEIFLAAKDAPCDFWGFKDVGLPVDQMIDLCKCMHDNGKTVFMESLAHTEEEGLTAVKVAAKSGFDYLLGTNYYDSVRELATELNVKYLPFVGERRDHHTYGEIDDLVRQAVEFYGKGTYGINLAGFRYVGDATTLIKKLIASIDGPVSCVGSVDSFEKLDLLKETNPWAFTIGGAFFEKKFAETFSDSIKIVEEYMAK